VHIPRGESGAAEPGQMVTVEVTRWPTPTRGPVGRVVEVLGAIDEPGVDTEIILRKHNIPDEHGGEAIEEARRIGGAVKERDLRGRTDFRDRVVVTIDGEHARDFDDAISIERFKNGNIWLGVHIADVSHYVRWDDAPLRGSIAAAVDGLERCGALRGRAGASAWLFSRDDCPPWSAREASPRPRAPDAQTSGRWKRGVSSTRGGAASDRSRPRAWR